MRLESHSLMTNLSADDSNSSAPKFLAGGGDMGVLMRRHDWSTSRLGDPETWPQSLRTAVSLMLNSRYPMFIAWGPSLAFLYNDGYVPIFGAKHPHTLGLPFAEVWSDIWEDIRPLVETAMSGEATFNENFHLVMDRNGYPEDTWYTFSYSPVRDESGDVAGMFCACQETTTQVLGEQRLAAQIERQRRLFEQAPGFIAVLGGPEHVFEFVNDAYVRLAGARDYVGKPVRDVIPEVEGQGFYELLDSVYRSGERHVAADVALRLRRTDDDPEVERFVNFIYAPVTDENDRVTGIFVEGYDVTDAHLAKEAEARHERHQRLLIDELNHRVKNTLAIVQGLAQQTFKGGAATDGARRAFEGRLLALADAHTLLTRENWEHAELGDLVAQSLHAHGASPSRLRMSGPPIRLPPNTALTIAMALHELATNASKYGALSNDQGQVKVEWTTEEDPARHLRLRWAEVDGPPVQVPRNRGFGTRMIERALANVGGGRVRLDFRPAGVVCDMEVGLPMPDGDPVRSA